MGGTHRGRDASRERCRILLSLHAWTPKALDEEMTGISFPAEKREEIGDRPRDRYRRMRKVASHYSLSLTSLLSSSNVFFTSLLFILLSFSLSFTPSSPIPRKTLPTTTTNQIILIIFTNHMSHIITNFIQSATPLGPCEKNHKFYILFLFFLKKTPEALRPGTSPGSGRKPWRSWGPGPPRCRRSRILGPRRSISTSSSVRRAQSTSGTTSTPPRSLADV